MKQDLELRRVGGRGGQFSRNFRGDTLTGVNPGKDLDLKPWSTSPNPLHLILGRRANYIKPILIILIIVKYPTKPL